MLDNTRNIDAILLGKMYLHSVSAAGIRSVFSSFAGPSTSPALLFDCVDLDRMQAMDFRILRDTPDHSFRLFGSTKYNKGLVTRAALVRTSNRLLMQLPRANSLRICPFSSVPNYVHAGVTGKMRRQSAPFLWMALLALQPLQDLNEDMPLEAALAVKILQIRIRSVNLCSERSIRNLSEIADIQQISFRA